MTYEVTVESEIPAGAPDLDPLQREGVGNLLGRHLHALDAVEGPDGVEVDVLDHLIAVHPGGALVKVVVDAPALEFAEEAVRAVMTDVLEQTELLADWTIVRCEVELHPDLAQESLHAADGPDAPPDDPAERARRHAEGGPGPESGKLDDAEVATMGRRLRAMAPQLQAFSLDSFGYSEDEGDSDGDNDGEEHGSLISKEAAEVAAGAVVWAIHVLVDELFGDLARLEEDDDAGSVAESDAVFMVLEELPERYVLQYDVLFVRRLVTTAVVLTTRLTQSGFVQLSCVAEELLLRLLLIQANVTADTFGLLDDEVGTALGVFADGVYEDLDHEWLYEPAADGIEEDPALAQMGIAPMGIKDWFTPFNEGRYVHPYAVGEEETTPAADPA
ncbi:hypothetical protein [Streptomyces sp. NBC_01190]|uniref:hypothetical protein n=1 Tax=Streptomyces sp. NBC_01190 TaxID=2903767 RepID=UPI00386F4627|nr:hypothetical protein OG519_18395 [Streptomyces sp. NBC_01190]